MASIQRNWNGRIYGTNTGNLALQLEGNDNELTGILRLLDDRFGLAVYEIHGTYVEGLLNLKGTPHTDTNDGVAYGDLSAEARLQSDGRLEGEWTTTISTGGTFQAWPHGAVANMPKADVPEQINTCSRQLGAMRLYSDDVRTLISHIIKDFRTTRPVITYYENGNEKNVYADDFESLLPQFPEQRYLKISIQEPDLYGINRSAIIELSANGENVIRVQGVQESWVIGKAQWLHDSLIVHKKMLATQFRRFGLTVNTFIGIAALAALPGLSTFWQRASFLLLMAIIQFVINKFHSRFVPNFVLYPASPKGTLLGRIGPSILSWSATIIGGVVAAVAYGVLKGELVGSPLERLIMSLFAY